MARRVVVPQVKRVCFDKDCCAEFECYPKSKRIYCSQSCAAKNHKSDCLCCVCKARRKESIGELNPAYGKSWVHKEDCECASCLSKKGFKNGPNNPNWKGGVSLNRKDIPDPYPSMFNESLKVKIRNRDNNTCQLCGRTKEQEGRNLAVHHIDYDKEHCEPENLITLCNNCNGKVNKNRKSWERKLKEKLKLRIYENTN